ncbi:DUF5675 family protein [Segatella copri]|uniref:DUF5675 family protein n=1 Tax=Segatella copri TaxID=165179 RepID=UPI001F3CEA9B|nr:DUF5675 family protein [Segatella copri]
MMKKKTKIMELKLVRFAKKKGYTIGRLYCLGEREEEGTCDGIAGNGSQTGDLEADEGLKGDGGQKDDGGLKGDGGLKPFCDTLEPPRRNLLNGGKWDKRLKVKGMTAIPEGRYLMRFTYSPKFGKRLFQLMDVPLFDGIRIHSGNSVKDTQGCILVGNNTKVGRLENSRAVLFKLEMMLKGFQGPDDLVFITIV